MICIELSLSIEIQVEIKPIFHNLFLSDLLLNNFYDLFLAFFSFFLNKFILIDLLSCFICHYYLFINIFIIILLFFCLLLNLIIFFNDFMNIDANISFSTLTLLKIFANLRFVFIVFLHEIDVSVILSTCRPKVTPTHLIQLAHSFSFHKWLAKLVFIVGKCTRQLLFALSPMRAHSRLVMSSLITFDYSFSFLGAILSKQVIVNKSPLKLIHLFVMVLSVRNRFSWNQAQWVDHFAGSYFLFIFRVFYFEIETLYLLLCHTKTQKYIIECFKHIYHFFYLQNSMRQTTFPKIKFFSIFLASLTFRYQLIMIQIKIDLIYLFKVQGLQNQRKKMNRQQHFIQLCRESINCAAKVFDPQLSNIFSSAEDYHFVRSIILDPYVAIMYCIHVKNHLRNIGNGLNPTKSNFGQNEETSDMSPYGAVQVAAQTDFFKYLKNITKSNNSYDYSDENDDSENTAKKMKKVSQSMNGSKFSKLWYESILFINMLIFSKKNENLMNSSCEHEKLECLNNLRMELLARLSINIQIELGNQCMSFEKFEGHLKMLICYDSYNQQKSIKQIITIIKEFMSFIQVQQQLAQAKKFAKLFGKSMMRMLMEYLRKLLFDFSYSKDLIRQMFSTINQYMELINLLRSKQTYIEVVNTDGNDEIEKIERGQMKSYHGDVFAYCHYDFVKNAIKYIDFVEDFRNDQSLLQCLDILDKITLVAHFIYYDKLVGQQKCQSFTENLNTVMNKIITKWMDYHNKNGINQNHNNQYFLQCQIINIFGNIFNNSLLSFQHEELMLSSINFCKQIISKIPIKVQLGEKSIFATMFYYLRDVLHASNTLENDKQIIIELRQLTKYFFQACFCQEYDNINSQFLEDIDNCRLFFDPIVEFIQKVYLTNNKLISENHFTIMKNYINKLSKTENQKITILEILMIQSIKDIQSFKNIEFYQQKCSLLFLLLQLYSNNKNLQLLMLLDAISDQIINDETTQMGSHSICIWQYIDRQTNLTLDLMMEFLSTEIVNYVMLGNSLYLAKYAIYLLSRLCTKIMKVQENIQEKSRKLINKHLAPVIGFVNNLNLTVLDNTDSYKQRSKILELMCLVGIKKIQDVYNLYFNIKHNICKTEEADILKYFIDVSGLLSYRGIQGMEEVIIEIIFNEIQANLFALDIFTIESLERPIIFQIYTTFLLQIMNKLDRLSKFNKQDCLMGSFELIFKNKLDIFSEVYDQENYIKIHQIWLTFSKLDKITMKFPTIPKILYGDKALFDIVDWIFRHIWRLNNIQQIRTLYSNVFERKYFRREEMVKQEFLKDIANGSKLPHYLFLVADYIDRQGEGNFFDYEAVIQSQIVKIYNKYKEIHSSEATLDFFDDSDSQLGFQDFISFLQTSKQVTYRESINYLIRANHIFDYVSIKNEITFLEYKDHVFMEKMKKIIQTCNA